MTVADFFSVLFCVYLTCPIIAVYYLPDIITAALLLFGATIDCTPFGILTCLLNFCEGSHTIGEGSLLGIPLYLWDTLVVIHPNYLTDYKCCL